jgi:hypothetical protein
MSQASITPFDLKSALESIDAESPPRLSCQCCRLREPKTRMLSETTCTVVSCGIRCCSV